MAPYCPYWGTSRSFSAYLRFILQSVVNGSVGRVLRHAAGSSAFTASYSLARRSDLRADEAPGRDTSNLNHRRHCKNGRIP